MAHYKYQARSKEGGIYEREVEALDRLAIYGIIKDEGGVVVKIEEEKKILSKVSLKGLLSGIKTQEKINFAKNLGEMVKAGLSVTRALEVMSKQTKRKAFKNLLSEVGEDVKKGLTLSESLGKHPKVFSALFISMIKAGEESGSMAESLHIVSDQMEKSHLLVKKVRGAMIYPAVIIAVMIVLASLLLIYMVPTLTSTFEGLGVKLPLPTRILITLSDFLLENTLLVFGGLVAFIVGVVLFWRSESGKRIFDILSLKIPVIGTMVAEVQVARTTRTLSSLLSAGVEIVEALAVTADVLQNHLYKKVVEDAHEAIQKGETLSSVFGKNEHLYPVFVGEMTAVGEETGKISDMLMNVASFYENEVDQKTKDLSTIIEPILMIIIGAGVGLFAISMLAPTYSLVDYI